MRAPMKRVDPFADRESNVYSPGLFGLSQAETIKPSAAPAPTVAPRTVQITTEGAALMPDVLPAMRPRVGSWVNQVYEDVYKKISQNKNRFGLSDEQKALSILYAISHGMPEPDLMALSGGAHYWEAKQKRDKRVDEWRKTPKKATKNALFKFVNRMMSPDTRPMTYGSAKDYQKADETTSQYVPTPPWESGDWNEAWFWWGVSDGKLNPTLMHSKTAKFADYQPFYAIPFMWDEVSCRDTMHRQFGRTHMYCDSVQSGNLRIRWNARGQGFLNGKFFQYFPFPVRVKKGYEVVTTKPMTMEELVKFLNVYNTSPYYNKSQRDKIPAAYTIEDGIPTVDLFGPLDHIKQSRISKILASIPAWGKIAVALIPGIGPAVTAASFAVSAIQVKEGMDMQKQIKRVMDGQQLLMEKTEGKVPLGYRLQYEQWLEVNKENIEGLGLNIDLMKSMSINEGVEVMKMAQAAMKSLAESGVKPASIQDNPEPVDPAEPLSKVSTTLVSEEQVSGNNTGTILMLGGGVLAAALLLGGK